MVSERIQKIDYDPANDILYIKFPCDKGMSYSSDSLDGLEIMRDMETDELTGLMVYYAKAKRDVRQKLINSLGYGINLSTIMRAYN